MLEREWVSLTDPDDPHDRYVFDVSFMLSSYTCIYGRGCPGIGSSANPEIGCCALGAHYVDDDDRDRVEAMVDVLGPAYMQNHADAKRRGVTARMPDGEYRTRVRDGACIFLNRQEWPTGAGCAMHHYAVARGEHHMTYKPEVCWIVPLRREVEEGVADDGEPCWTTTITSYDRGAWGPGGSNFPWWCTESPMAHVGVDPVYVSMEQELRAMSSDRVYEELAAYLSDRRAHARKPLPFRVVGQS
ncbi:MAG: hypothetical protein GEU74_07450 [Nitriliruptorales bacterium]|nr:hypothetical protein [Nitriliruptorales bacterium]